MRFRIAAKPPLAPFKAWFDISDNDSIFDIRGVKAQICSRISQLSAASGCPLTSEQIILYIDDFELLDDSSLQVIKENDLVQYVIMYFHSHDH